MCTLNNPRLPGQQHHMLLACMYVRLVFHFTVSLCRIGTGMTQHDSRLIDTRRRISVIHHLGLLVGFRRIVSLNLILLGIVVHETIWYSVFYAFLWLYRIGGTDLIRCLFVWFEPTVVPYGRIGIA